MRPLNVVAERSKRCVRSTDVGRFLDGLLDAEGVRSLLAHRRTCAACGEALERARDARAELRARNEDSYDDDAPLGGRSSGPKFVPWFLRGNAGGAKRRRRLPFVLMIGAAIGVAIAAGRGFDDDLDDAAYLRAALSRGTAVLSAPRGPQEGRPRAASAILPSPVSEATLAIVGRDGTVVFERRLVPGEEGVALLPYRIEGLRGAVDAWRLVAPFPFDDALRLEPGASYGVVFRAPGGVVASGAPFTIR